MTRGKNLTIIVEDKPTERLFLSFLNDLEASNKARLQWHGEQVLVQNSAANALDATLSERFEEHFQRWKKDTGPHSNAQIIVGHPDYLKMIKMGWPVVPLMLKKLQDDPQHIFHALFKITGENPVPKAHVGKFQDMIADWLDWGRQKGYL